MTKEQMLSNGEVFATGRDNWLLGHLYLRIAGSPCIDLTWQCRWVTKLESTGTIIQN
jgi:hypothetical protein